jgi:hypothetical protein
MRRRTLLASAALATAAVLAGVGVVRLETSAPLVKFPLTAAEVLVADPEGKDRADLDTCLLQQDGANLVRCTKDLLLRNVKLGRYGAALGQLHDAVSRNTDVMAGCHSYAHDMGKLVYEQGMPLSEIYKIGWNECRLGFPHGALQIASADLDKKTVGPAFKQLCGDMGAFGPEAEGDCVHLIGHIIADLYGSDLEGATEACGSTGIDRLWGRCMHGVLMRNSEFVIAADAVGATDDEKAKALEIWGSDRAAQESLLVRICTELVPGSVQPTCANSIPTVLSVLWDYDWPEIHRACTGFVGGVLDQCNEGIAGAVISNKGWDVAGVLVACEAGVGRIGCFRSAGGVYGSARPDGDPDVPLCGKLEGADRAACREGFAAGADLAARLMGGGSTAASPPAAGTSPTRNSTDSPAQTS